MDELWRALQEDLARERGPIGWLRSRSRATRLVLVALLGTADAFFFHTFLAREDLHAYPSARLLAMLLACALLLLAQAWQSFRPLHRPALPAWVARALVTVTLLLPVVFALLPEMPTARPADYHLVAYDWWCLSTGLAQGAALLLVVRVLDRGHADTLVAAAAGAALGMLGLLLSCPINYPVHLLTGHASMPVAMVAGAWLWRRAGR